MVSEVHCYNKGCGKTYNPDKNTEGETFYFLRVPLINVFIVPPSVSFYTFSFHAGHL